MCPWPLGIIENAALSLQPDSLPQLRLCWELKWPTGSLGEVRGGRNLQDTQQKKSLQSGLVPLFLTVETGRTARRGCSRGLHVVISLVLPCELFPSRSEALTRFSVQCMSRVLPFTGCVEILFQESKIITTRVKERSCRLKPCVQCKCLLWILLEPMFYMAEEQPPKEGRPKKITHLAACYP